MRKKKTSRKKLFLLLIGIVLIFIVMKIAFSFGSFFPTAARVVFHPGATLAQTDGRTNVLLLGIGGGTHDGPDLTDTIIFASINWKKNTVNLISVPRDLWIPDISGSVKKINEAYSQGESDNQHKGLVLAKAVVQEVVGQPIHYAIRLDFQGFIDGINEIGGIDVKVPNTLDDYEYPITGKEDDTCGHTPEDLQTFIASAPAELAQWDFFSCRYMHLHVDKGMQHMDGQLALEYVRSRHGVNGEGSDFARSGRQQLVIEATRNKMISSAFFNPGKLLGLFGILQNSIDTDITDKDLGLFLDKLPQLKSAKIISQVLDDGDYTTGRSGLLQLAPISDEYDNLSVQIPRIGNGDFSEIQAFVVCELTAGTCPVSPTPMPQEKAAGTK